MTPAAKGLLIAAPGSGAGKTTVTLALLRALRNRGLAVSSAKSGPDYIDPKFHEAASGGPRLLTSHPGSSPRTQRSEDPGSESRGPGNKYFLETDVRGSPIPVRTSFDRDDDRVDDWGEALCHPSEAASGHFCVNLDAWAMSERLLMSLANRQAAEADVLLVEGAMGLFDGSANGKGSAADLAALLGLPVVLVVDCAKQAQSVAALVSGFVNFRKDSRIAGLILNRVGSSRHEALLRRALEPLGIPVLGALARSPDLALPERHLGLVLAGEHPELSTFLERAASRIAESVDLDALMALASPLASSKAGPTDALQSLPPLGQRIAVARDLGFAFAYPHMLDGWRRAGAELSFFSPLADEAPESDADAIYLPGGYPELHAGKLAAATAFKEAMREAASRNTLIYGECGGYMTLGEMLEDAGGTCHKMLGLLPVATSFAKRKLHLGYRQLTPSHDTPFSGPLMAHEFHYASIVREDATDRLFSAQDAEGNALPDMGLRTGRVMGSYAHIICPAG